MKKPRHRTLLVLGFRDIFQAADRVMAILEADPIGLEVIDDVIVRNLRRKHKLPRELDLLPDGEAWLLVEFGARRSRRACAREPSQSAWSGRVRESPHRRARD